MINLSPPSIKFPKTHNTPQEPQNQWWNMHIVNYPLDIRQIQFQGIKNLAKSWSFWLAQPAQTTNISLSDDDSKYFFPGPNHLAKSFSGKRTNKRTPIQLKYDLKMFVERGNRLWMQKRTKNKQVDIMNSLLVNDSSRQTRRRSSSLSLSVQRILECLIHNHNV